MTDDVLDDELEGDEAESDDTDDEVDRAPQPKTCQLRSARYLTRMRTTTKRSSSSPAPRSAGSWRVALAGSV